MDETRGEGFYWVILGQNPPNGASDGRRLVVGAVFTGIGGGGPVRNRVWRVIR